MVSIYDKNFRAFPLTGEEIEVLQCKKVKFRNAGYADIYIYKFLFLKNFRQR
jgi:hypothetical protein